MKLFRPLFLLLAVTAAGAVAAGDVGDAVILSAQDIAAFQAQKMPDVLNHIPGVSASSSSVSIHGSYKVKVFVDGRPINDPSSSYGALEWDLVNPDDVERIEVHRGNGAVKYGQDASGGVILVTTSRSRTLTGNLKAYGGNQQIRYGNAALQGESGRFSTGASASYETTNGYAINNDKQRRRVGAKAGYVAADGKSVLLSADYLDDERGLAGYPDAPTPFARKASDMMSAAVQVNYGAMTSATSWISGYSRNTDSSTALDRRLRVDELSEKLTAAFEWAHIGATDYGASAQRNRAAGSAFADQEESTWSVFAVHSLPEALLPVQFSFGLRANFNSDFDDAFNPELKAVYKREKWQLAAAFSGSNNTPSFTQRYNESSSTKPNPDLDMETARNFSVTLTRAWAPRFSSQLTAFYNVLNDRITYVRNSNGAAGQYWNLGEVTYAGGDASVTWNASAQVVAKGSYAYLAATDKRTGKWLTGKPRHAGSVSLQYRPTVALSMHLSAQFEDKSYQDTANTRVLPGYGLLDFKAEYSWRRLSAFLEMSNLLDRTYYYSDGLLAPPRTWFIGVGYSI